MKARGKKGLIIDGRFLHSSGIGVYLRTLLPFLLANFQDKKIIIYCRSSDVSWFQPFQRPNLEVRSMSSQCYSLAEQWFWLKNIFAHRGYVFWSPQYNIPLTHRGPLIATIHDLAHLVLPEYKNNFFKFSYAKLMFSRLTHRADQIICVSNFTKNQLIGLVHVNSSQVKVVHLGLNESRLKTIQAPSIQLPKRYVLFVGNIKNHKNLKNLILAMRLVQVRYDLPLVIAGNKHGFITPGDDVFKIADELGVKYIFSGSVSDPELAYLYKNASALILPSFLEGFGLPPLEAMYLSCPVAASNAASIPEVCGNAACYFDPHNTEEMAAAISKIISDEVFANQLIAEGNIRWKQFDERSFIAKTSEILQGLLN